MAIPFSQAIRVWTVTMVSTLKTYQTCKINFRYFNFSLVFKNKYSLITTDGTTQVTPFSLTHTVFS